MVDADALRVLDDASSGLRLSSVSGKGRSVVRRRLVSGERSSFEGSGAGTEPSDAMSSTYICFRSKMIRTGTIAWHARLGWDPGVV